MVSNDALCGLLHSENIPIMLATLPERVKGFYSTFNEEPSIVMNRCLDEWGPEYRSILAEELGHHFTSSGKNVPLSKMTYYERTQHDRSESKAVRWAADFLIPTELLLSRIEDCLVSSLQELAEAFQVTLSSSTTNCTTCPARLSIGLWQAANTFALPLSHPSIFSTQISVGSIKSHIFIAEILKEYR